MEDCIKSSYQTMFAVLALLVPTVFHPVYAVQSTEQVLRRQCKELLQQFDRIVSHTHSADVQAGKVAGFPYLRVNRFLASFRDQRMHESGWQQWLELMRMQDLHARRVEWRHLDSDWQAFVSQARPDDLSAQSTIKAVDRCGQYLLGQDLGNPERRRQLQLTARVADDYRDWQRLFGLYRLTRHAAMKGINRLAVYTQRQYRQPLVELIPLSTRKSYMPETDTYLDSVQLRSLMRTISRNPLNIPLPSARQAQQLFRHYAPVWVVGQATENDRIGQPGWLDGEDLPSIDTSGPVVYTLISHTRFRGVNLLQLVYTIWFPGRTAESAIDTLAGHLDGITWRVTLDRDGQALVYDSMHNCGCYHLFFPTHKLALRPANTVYATNDLEEGILVPQFIPSQAVGQRMHLFITAGSHDLVRVQQTVPDMDALVYSLHDYDRLRGLPVAQGHTRSLFNTDGLVPGSERLESIYLWPMGVLRPGAMRQWGHHATAFVGRRHFDQADLLERYFEQAGMDN